jgi:hypothetical protein
VIGYGNRRIGDLVRFIPSANEYTPGYSEGFKNKVGIVFDFYSPERKDWCCVLFAGEEVRVYHEDLEKIG